MVDLPTGQSSHYVNELSVHSDPTPWLKLWYSRLGIDYLIGKLMDDTKHSFNIFPANPQMLYVLIYLQFWRFVHFRICIDLL